MEKKKTMNKEQNSIELISTTPGTKENLFRRNDDGMFNASSLAKEYGKDVYGYTRSQKVKDFVLGLCLEYEQDHKLEFTDQGNIVRVISGGTAPGTWMHLDIFIKFLGWLDPKLERDFIKGVLTANKKQHEDPLQLKLAQIESEITSLKKKLARNAIFKELTCKQKLANQLLREIDIRNKSMRKQIADIAKKAVSSYKQLKP